MEQLSKERGVKNTQNSPGRWMSKLTPLLRHILRAKVWHEEEQLFCSITLSTPSRVCMLNIEAARRSTNTISFILEVRAADTLKKNSRQICVRCVFVLRGM